MHPKNSSYTHNLRISNQFLHPLHLSPKGPQRFPANLYRCSQPLPKTIANAATATNSSSSQDRKNFKETWDETGPAWVHHSNFPIRQAMLDCHDASQLLSLLRHHENDLHPADTAAAWHVAVQLRFISMAAIDHSPHAELTQLLLSLTEVHSSNMDATCLSTTAWALAASGNGTKDHMQAILLRAQDEIITFRPQELCILFWAAYTHEHATIEMQHAVYSALSKVVEAGMLLDHFTSHDLSVLVWSMGKSSYIDPMLISKTESECLKKASNFDPGDISRLMHGFSMLRHNPSMLLPSLTQHAEGKLERFTPDDITLFMMSLGKLGVEPDSSFMKRICKRMANMVPQPVGARRGGAIGRAPSSSVSVPAAGAKQTAERGGPNTTTQDSNDDEEEEEDDWSSSPDGNNTSTGIDFSKNLHPTHAAHIMWALGKIDHRPAERGFILRVHRHLASAPGVYSGEEINAILWATSRLGADMSSPALLASVQRLTCVAMAEDPIILASALRSVSSLLSRNPALLQEEKEIMEAFVAACLSGIEPFIEKSFLADDLALLVVALGTMEIFPSASVAAKLQKCCTQYAQECSSVVLPRLAWATVRLRWTNIHKLMDSIAVASSARLGLVSTEGLSQLAWSFASIDRPFAELANGLASQCTAKGGFDRFPAKDKARMAWAFGHMMRFGDPSMSFLLKLLKSISARDLNTMDGLSVSAVVWACSRCTEHPGPIIDALAVHVDKNLRKFSGQQLTSAVAVLKKHKCKKEENVESIAQHALYNTVKI